MQNKIRILVVDDHQFMIEGITSSIAAIGNFDVVTTNTCDSAFSLLKMHQKINPFQILFTDLSFDNRTSETLLESGERLIKAIKTHGFSLKIGVITGHTETNRVFNVINNLKPNAYLLKTQCNATELGFAISKMLSNEYYYTHEIHQKIMKRNIIGIKMDEIAIQILKELRKHSKINNLEGLITKSNGTPLKLRAIENKLANLRIDLDANNNVDLVLKAKELGIID